MNVARDSGDGDELVRAGWLLTGAGA